MRTNVADVRNLLSVEYDTLNNPSLEPYINTATSIVTKLAAYDTKLIMTSDDLALVEMWLGAHYYQISDPGYQSRSTGGGSGSFNGQTTMGFWATRFGQQALLLDATGYLAKRDKEAQEGGIRKFQIFAADSDC